MDREGWRAAISGEAKSQTQLNMWHIIILSIIRKCKATVQMQGDVYSSSGIQAFPSIKEIYLPSNPPATYRLCGLE